MVPRGSYLQANTIPYKSKEKVLEPSLCSFQVSEDPIKMHPCSILSSLQVWPRLVQPAPKPTSLRDSSVDSAEFVQRAAASTDVRIHGTFGRAELDMLSWTCRWFGWFWMKTCDRFGRPDISGVIHGNVLFNQNPFAVECIKTNGTK